MARRGARVVLAVLAGCVLAPMLGTTSSADNSVPDPGWVLTAATTTTNLVDGQFVTLNVKSRNSVAVNRVEVRECRLGPDYSDAIGGINPDSGNCPPFAVSSSADDFVSKTDRLAVLARSPVGANFNFRVGSGTVNWRSGGHDLSITCDPSHACALVAKIFVDGDVQYRTTPLAFVDSDPLASCGGPDPNALASGASDELSDAWAGWTRQFCAKTKSLAPTRAAFTAESDAVASFAQGSLDLVYTAAGYNKAAGLTTLDASQRRAAVAIPIGLNASVVAAGGGYHQVVGGDPIGDKVPYPNDAVQMTAGEAGALLGGGLSWTFRIGGPHLGPFLNRNPGLNGVPVAVSTPIMAPSQALSQTWFLTHYLATLDPGDFVDPSTNPPTARAASSTLALSVPHYDSVNLFTGRPVLSKAAFSSFISSNDGPMWVFTDRVTAKALGLTPVALENAAHRFVAPTADSMAAAVTTMKADENGLLQPDVQTTAATARAAARAEGVHASDTTPATPYPLTYVEYALVPAEPLVDSTTCHTRSSSQAQLGSWLDYVLGDGQKNLPAGLEPLSPSLLTDAKAAVAKVGKSPVSGACAGHTTSAASQPPAAGAPSLRSGTPVVVAGASASAPGDTTASTRPNQTRIIIPAFAGNTVPDSNDGALALAGIVIVTSLGVFITSRHLGPRVAALAAGRGGSAPVTVEPAVRGSSSFRIPMLVVLWVSVGIAGAALVVYPLASLFEERDQRALFDNYRQTLSKAAHANEGLHRASSSTDAPPPDLGSAVGVMEIGALRSQEVALEGIDPSETRKGPGHVPGTAGLGQPGNSVLVGRRNSFGGIFGHIGALKKGDKIVVTTTQGQSLYVVASVDSYKIVDKNPRTSKNETTRSSLFGRTRNDQLTLVTSGSRHPLNESFATVVVAKMRGRPFTPTPQGARTDAQTNLGSDGNAWATIALAALGYAVVVAASIFAYRKLRFRVAYVLTIAPLVALTVVAAEALSRLIPTWT